MHIEIDGRPVPAQDPLAVPAFFSYGHFTAMQVRGGRVRGLALHLARLDSATRELFGAGIDGDHVRGLVRGALERAGVRDASTRVYVYWAPDAEAATLAVTVRPPAVMAEAAQALMPVPYERPVPHIKHLGGFAQTYYGRAAVAAGFDDALLTGAGGVITEGSITNIAFWDGESVVWPDAPALLGITMALLEPLLPSVRRQVTLGGLGSYRAAFVTNSQGIAPVRRIGPTEFAVDEALMKTVAGVYADVPWDAI
ncbi:aminotransferase class IV [Streptomyces sp. NBC_01465]|uniref:aminotransferase class IV n=1 Tax=Streptomyces sp. NBC_01465 TaxID=2903878 RepID=UPI002E348DC6|nr:aminotransferase class IV [Streptomyces sp. NBC_01465]